MTSGALTMPANTVRPWNRVYLTSANAASVPITTAAQAVRKAMRSDSHRPLSISVSCASLRYQSSVKPPQTLGTGEALNE